MKLNLRKYIGAVAYPVGSIYCTTKDIDPATIWGGTWEKLEGKFLFGASDGYTVGTTGGEESHTLTLEEIPIHDGHLGGNFSDSAYIGHPDDNSYFIDANKLVSDGYMGKYANRPWRIVSETELAVKGFSKGGSQPHNNMPPYQVVHMWIRTTLAGGGVSS